MADAADQPAFTNDLQYGCGVSHRAYLTVVVDHEHLGPFALWTAFPSSLAGHCSCDYYGPSVTIGLAPRRPSRIPLAPDVSSVT